MTATANPTTIRTDVLVIGAGQAGLAAAYHLQRLGVDYRIVEADVTDRRRLATPLRLAEAVLAGGL